VVTGEGFQVVQSGMASQEHPTSGQENDQDESNDELPEESN